MIFMINDQYKYSELTSKIIGCWMRRQLFGNSEQFKRKEFSHAGKSATTWHLRNRPKNFSKFKSNGKRAELKELEKDIEKLKKPDK